TSSRPPTGSSTSARKAARVVGASSPPARRRTSPRPRVRTPGSSSRPCSKPLPHRNRHARKSGRESNLSAHERDSAQRNHCCPRALVLLVIPESRSDIRDPAPLRLTHLLSQKVTGFQVPSPTGPAMAQE